MNSISPQLISGTLGELLVQVRLLQYGVQAAPPLKDSGNDLIAIRGSAMRSLQVKTTTSCAYVFPESNKNYHILVAVHLVVNDREVSLDNSEVFLIKKEELNDLPRKFLEIESFKLCPERIDALFPPELDADTVANTKLAHWVHS